MKIENEKIENKIEKGDRMKDLEKEIEKRKIMGIRRKVELEAFWTVHDEAQRMGGAAELAYLFAAGVIPEDIALSRAQERYGIPDEDTLRSYLSYEELGRSYTETFREELWQNCGQPILAEVPEKAFRDGKKIGYISAIADSWFSGCISISDAMRIVFKFDVEDPSQLSGFLSKNLD